MKTENEELLDNEGTHLSDYLEETEEEPTEEATPTTEDDEDEDAIPAALQEDEDEEERDPEDLKLDPILAENPDIARRWEQHVKGVEKIVTRTKEKEQALEARLAGAETMIDYAGKLLNPATAAETFMNLREEIIQQTGIDPLGYQPDGQPNGSKYGLAHDTDDAVVEVAKSQVAKELLGEDFEYLKKIAQRERAAERVNEVLPTLQSTYGSWVTAELTAEAIRKFPNLPPDAAFGAAHGKRIAKEMHSYAESRKPKERISAPTVRKAQEEPVAEADWRSHKIVSMASLLD